VRFYGLEAMLGRQRTHRDPRDVGLWDPHGGEQTSRCAHRARL
jgi:hypothetical protein